jgi:hypothetical protein
VVLEVAKADVAGPSRGLLDALRILDLAVKELPVEEVIRRAFAGGAVEGEEEDERR